MIDELDEQEEPGAAYHAPRSIEDAVALLAEYGDEAKVLAGGQSLVPLLAFRLARPSVLVESSSEYVLLDAAGCREVADPCGGDCTHVPACRLNARHAHDVCRRRCDGRYCRCRRRRSSWASRRLICGRRIAAHSSGIR